MVSAKTVFVALKYNFQSTENCGMNRLGTAVLGDSFTPMFKTVNNDLGP
jgi:hypothetical protein